jgi:hypothetical protein
MALRLFRPQLGRAVSTDMQRLVARWHGLSAWFAVHCGHTTTAIAHGAAACRQYRAVYGQSDDKDDLKSLADCALVVSHAYLYVNEPDKCLVSLARFREATERAGGRIGGDYFRQLGTAYALQSRAGRHDEDDHASRVLKVVPEKMRWADEASSDDQLRFATRQYFLQRQHADVEACEGLMAAARRRYGAGSLEMIIAANYASAAELTTDDDAAHRTAYERLEQTVLEARPFPHQWAVSTLLLLTPRLRLDDQLRGQWARQVSYLNPLRRQ